MERFKRSVVKAVSWRVFAVVITTLIVWILTRKVEFAVTVGVLDTSIKIFAYILHERIWNRISFGRRALKETDYQI